MTVKLIEGRENDKVFARIQGVAKLTRRGSRQAMYKIGQGLRREASNEILHGSKTGVVYRIRSRSGRRRRHQSSAPGESHANQSGALRRSLSFQLRGASEIEFGYGVSSGREAPDYARFVEFGTARMKSRPSLRNALRAERTNIIQHLEREILEEIR